MGSTMIPVTRPVCGGSILQRADTGLTTLPWRAAAAPCPEGQSPGRVQMPQVWGRHPSRLTVFFTSPECVPAPDDPCVFLCQSGHAASAAPQASSPPDYTMAWAEYYRQQVAFYGQTLGQAQAHSQVCSQSPPRGHFPNQP